MPESLPAGKNASLPEGTIAGGGWPHGGKPKPLRNPLFPIIPKKSFVNPLFCCLQGCATFVNNFKSLH
jgi:hypothetical protein